MKFLKQFLVVSFLGVQCIGYAQSSKLDHITQKYDTYLNELNIGMGVLIKKGSKTEVSSIGKFNIDENSVFNIGSATKKMTAILLLQEEEKGNLKLSDSIGKYLSPIKNVDGSLTIETLLRHRSGLGELVGGQLKPTFFSKHDSIYATNFLDKIPPENPDKKGKYNYCNTNYILLGHLLEKINDKSYFDLLNERIFKTCNMENSYPYVTKQIPNLVHPTQHTKDVFEDLDHRFFTRYVYAAGSIASTMNDMTLFYDHLFIKSTLLSKTSLEKLIKFDDADYGLGMMKNTINDITYYGHGGNNVGYAYREYFNPKTNTMIMFISNTMQMPFFQILKDEVMNYSIGKTTDNRINKNVTKTFGAYKGTYFFKEMNANVQIIEENKQLYMVLKGTKLLLISYEKGILQADKYSIALKTNPKNKNELIFCQQGMEVTIKRI
jgi:D-alanyl-D-alanine carboxypeptidase